MSANAVGITQLVVPDTQLQPNLAGSNFTLLSTVLSFHRQNQFASRPRAFNSHWIPLANRFVRCRAAIRLRTARAVVLRLVADEGRPASVLVLQILNGVQGSFKMSAWLMTQRQDCQTGGFNSVLTGTERPCSCTALPGS